MAKLTKKQLENLNKTYKKTFKTSGCRVLSNEEMKNVGDSLSLLSSSDVKIIEAAKVGDYSNFNDASPLVRNYVGTLSVNKFIAEVGVSQDQISLKNGKVKKYVQDHALDAGFRIGLSALKHTHLDKVNLKALDEYANEFLLAKTLSIPSTEQMNNLRDSIGETAAKKEISKNLAKQVVFAKTLFLAQLGKYNLNENGKTSDYMGSIAETFVHGGRTNFILPYNDINNDVLNAFDGGEIGKTAELKSRLAATHSATQRKVNIDLSIEKESEEEKPNMTQVGKIFSNQYGMDIAVGGVGEFGPNKKPILSDGSAGHMYIRKQKGDANTCGSLMVGIESAASLKTSYTGHFHTPLAKSSKQSAFLADKFGPGEKTNGKVVDLSGLESEDLAYILKEFEKKYMALQNSTDQKKLSAVNEMLAGKRLSETSLISLMSKTLGMQPDFVRKIVGDSRKGLDARVQKETTNLSKQFKEILGAELSSQAISESIKVMQKTDDGKWKLSTLFEKNDTPSQKFSKFWQSVHKGEQLYLISKTKFNPTKINVNNRKISVGDNVEKMNLATPKEPSGFQKTLNKLTGGLLFSSRIKQFEVSKEDFEKQQVVNAFIDEHKNVVEQTRRSARITEDQKELREKLAKSLQEKHVLVKSPKIKEAVSKGENVRQF